MTYAFCPFMLKLSRHKKIPSPRPPSPPSPHPQLNRGPMVVWTDWLSVCLCVCISDGARYFLIGCWGAVWVTVEGLYTGMAIHWSWTVLGFHVPGLHVESWASQGCSHSAVLLWLLSPCQFSTASISCLFFCFCKVRCCCFLNWPLLWWCKDLHLLWFIYTLLFSVDCTGVSSLVIMTPFAFRWGRCMYIGS